MRKRLEFAEIRRRLQDAEVELVKLRQSVPKSPPEPLVLRSGERWLVLEMPPEVDLSSRTSSAGVHEDFGVQTKTQTKTWTRIMLEQGDLFMNYHLVCSHSART